MTHFSQRRKYLIPRPTVICLFLTQCVFMRISYGAEVFSIEPHYGSACGRTTIRVNGTGFSQDQINNGNQVQLVSNATSYECMVDKLISNETMIMCDTVSGMVEGAYYVKVDGILAADAGVCSPGAPRSSQCRFEVRKQNTPLIKSITPVAFPPGPESVLDMKALMFTDRFYTMNVATSTNGKKETMVLVVAGQRICAVQKEDGKFYGLQLDSSNSDYGHIKCKYGETRIGNSNASFVIGDGPYGRSCPAMDSLLVSINKQLYQFQTYAEITGVSPASGSTEGGITLAITGRYFTGTKANTKVYVGGFQCEIMSINSTEIQCVTPQIPASLPSHFSGNRGLTLNIWDGQTKTYAQLGDIETLNTSDSGYSLFHTDQSYFSHPASNYVSRAQGFFIAPYTGEYSFKIKSADVSSLRLSTDGDPANKVEVAKCESTCPEYSSTPGQTSGRMSLTEQQKYYMEVLHSHGSSGDPSVKVAAHLYNTDLTNQSTGIAAMEHQIVKVNSTVIREVQKIQMVVESPSGSSLNEVQVVVVTEINGTLSDATFRLGLYGVYTEPLTTSTGFAEIAVAIKNLPWYINGNDNIGVQREEFTTPDVKVSLRIQFFTNRGNIPPLEYMVFGGSKGEQLEIQVTEEVNGKPEPNTFALEMEGIISPVFTPADDESAIINKIGKMFTTRCPGFLGETGVFHNSFESNDTVDGEWTEDQEAFCGRGYVKNPVYLYENTSGLYLQPSLSTMCFAYYGAIQNLMAANYSYSGEDRVIIGYKYVFFPISIEEGSDVWKYTCIEIATKFAANHINKFLLFQLHGIMVRRTGDVFIDEVYIGNGPSTTDRENVNLLRLKPVRPNGRKIHYTKGAVTTVDTIHRVEITFISFECGHNISLFSVVAGQTNGLSVTVERLSASSPPVSGSFTLTFKGDESVAIPPSVTGEQFKEILMSSVPTMGEIYTYKHGDCANFDLSVAFLSKPGDQETMQFTSQLSGVDVTMEVVTVTNGSLTLDPIQGDMLHSYSTLPQVTAFVNDIPTRCSETSVPPGCSFQWTAAASAPVLQSCCNVIALLTLWIITLQNYI